MSLIKRFLGQADQKQVWAWAFYDFANSSYSLLIFTFVFPLYFKEVIVGGELGDFYWGVVVSISVLFGGLLAPVVGAVADRDRRKKIKFVRFALIAIGGTAALYFTGSDTLFLTALIFVITNLCFEVAQTLYDSFLGHLSTPQTSGRISGFAWGLGYIGGVVSLLAFRPLYEPGFEGPLLTTYKLTFPLTALFFLVFALPAFLLLKDSREVLEPAEPLTRKIRRGIGTILETIKNVRNYKNIGWFLLGFYLLNDALVTVFAFLPIFARSTIGFSFREITILLLIVQILAFPAAAIFGWLSDKTGPKKILLVCLAVWMLIILMLAAPTSKQVFYVVAFLGALVVGSSQAVARSWLSQLVPEEKRFEFFGFNGFASKIAATIGPLIFGLVSSATGNQRLAVLTLLPFFAASFIIFSKVKDVKIQELPNSGGV